MREWIACGVLVLGCKTDPEPKPTRQPGRRAVVRAETPRPVVPSAAVDPWWRDAPEVEERRALARGDANLDGELSPDEVDVMRYERATDIHSRYDDDGDGVLTPWELRPRGMPFGIAPLGEHETIDLDGNGAVSIEEIEARLVALERVRPRRYWLRVP